MSTSSLVCLWIFYRYYKQGVSSISTGFVLKSNEPIKSFYFEKLASQSIFDGLFMIAMINNSLYEKPK